MPKSTKTRNHTHSDEVCVQKFLDNYVKLSREELLKRFHAGKRLDGRSLSLELKLVAVKLFQLNDNKQRETARELGITRPALTAWVKEYGDIVLAAKPEVQIAERIESDLAIIQADVEKETYKVLLHGLRRLDTLIGTAVGTKSIYAISEGMKATVEILKAQKEIREAGTPKGNDFFMNIHNLMVQNAYGKQG